MKLVIAIVQTDDADGLMDALREQHYPFTQISSTGGFLRSGNATLVMGVQDHQVEPLIHLLRENSRTRTRLVNAAMSEPGSWCFTAPIEVRVGGATLFVLNIERFEQC
jgi:uncharacterized protein YaaQ